MMLRDWACNVIDADTRATLAQVRQRADAIERAEAALRAGYSPEEWGRILAADELHRRELRQLTRQLTDGETT